MIDETPPEIKPKQPKPEQSEPHARTEHAKRNWFDYGNLAVGTLGFLLALALGVLAQCSQSESDKEISHALNRMDDIADAMSDQASVMRNESGGIERQADATQNAAEATRDAAAASSKAAIASGEQAAASRAANAIAIGNLRATERPWVGLLGVMAQAPAANAEWIIQPVVKNIGRVPALNFTGQTWLTVTNSPPIVNDGCAGPGCARGILIPGTEWGYTIKVPASDMSVADTANIVNGRKRVFIVGAVEYQDPYGRNHSTRFCQRFQPERSAFTNCASGNSAD